MNIILLSGGSGKRLWPLSNETRSKQFLKLLTNEAGSPESMVQRVFGQIQEAGLNANVLIATSESQQGYIQAQLGSEVEIVLEPERRDTFPAIVLASAYLADRKDTPQNEVVLVLPVDPYVDRDYFKTLAQMEQLISRKVANIALMGIQPTYPSAKYGYIIPQPDGFLVDRFVEKPDEFYAGKLIAAGAYWNAGVFAFRLGYLLDIARQYIQGTTFAEVEKQFASLPKISFDYEVVEKEMSIAMVPYNGTWLDLGTWNTLTEVMEDQAIGRVILADSCRNTHVINELDIPLIVMGTKDLIVAASPDGILVSDKHQSSYLKTCVESIDKRPMYEECWWGDHKVLDYTVDRDGMMSLTRKILIKSGRATCCQAHTMRDQIWTFVEGSGELWIEGQVRPVKCGDQVSIHKGQKHTVRAISDLHLIEVQIGAELTEADVEYFIQDW